MVGPAWLVRPKRPAGLQGCALSLPHISFNRKEIREKKRKEGLGKGFAHAVNFPGLIKMRLIQEK